MGAAGSSNTVTRPTAPLAEPGVETFVYGRDEHGNENIRQRTRTSAFDVGEEPRSQGPSPYATFTAEELWSQRPSGQGLPNLRSPRRETLLTYEAQMTGWQTAEGHGPSFSQQHQEAVELSKVITQLSIANQQLATAHTATLAHLEALYVELRMEKEWRKRAETSTETIDEALKKRLTTEVDEEEIRRMEVRIDRLEKQLAGNRDTCPSRQRNVRQEEDRKLRTRIDRLESVTKTRGLDKEDGRQRFASSNRDPVGNQINGVTCNDRLPSNDHVPEHEFQAQISFDKETVAGSRSRVSETYDEEESRDSRCKDRSVTNLHLVQSTVEGCRFMDGIEFDGKEATRLSFEVERLKAEQLDYRSENERLAMELDEQKSMVAKLTNDYEVSKARHEEVESSLQKHREEYDGLIAKLNVAAMETDRLLKEIDAFNAEKDTAEARISCLERELQNSLLEKEIESQKASKLKVQLSEEVSDKKKQIKALEDALDEIQRLKETIKTERNGEDAGDDPKEDVGPIESIDDPQESPPVDRAANIEEFKKELTLKREARQRAIAAVSSEMERLRRELDAEKEAHSETSRVLDLLRSVQNEGQPRTEANTTSECSTRSKVIELKSDEPEVDVQRMEARRLTSILKVSDELRNDIRLQIDKVDDLRYHLETDPEHHHHRIRFLSDLTNRTRETVYTRERRASDLKDHLAQILVRLGDRDFLEQKDNVSQECERQLENIDSMKRLYNERLKVLSELKDAAVKELADTKLRLDHTAKKCECLEEDLKKADEKIDVQDTEISNLESQLGLTKADCRDLQNQMSLINGLFTQMLLGATSADLDLDRLTQLLQENHDLICDMAREEGTEAAALPKLLLDLIEQVEGSKGSQKRVEGVNVAEGETEKKEDDLQQEDIAHNLPKVWRVLLELLSCHAEGTPSASAASSSDPNICYKSVDTPAGPRLVISVSKTYIRLKELILEKKHLEKEMNRMKQLNTHLESKLGEQEKRLSAVSAELSKTWTIVDRMQAQHQQLHTHEQILRYELQQKRKMLQELKQELEYCREKWESARQKNTNTELEWRSLRREFAARKALAVHDSFNNSAESGFSDERGDDTDDEDNAVEGRIRLGPRRKPRKESPRAPTPDTESEQPTDTELSDPKTSSSATLEQRTPTPETEAELDETECTDSTLNTVSTNSTGTPLISESSQEKLNPLDQALTNVIQNLIAIDDNITSTSESFMTPNNEIILETVTQQESIEEQSYTAIKSSIVEPWGTSPIQETENLIADIQEETLDKTEEKDEPPSIMVHLKDSSNVAGEKTKNDEPSNSSECLTPTVTSATVVQSVFSIGPFFASNVSPIVVKNVQFSDPLIVGPSNRFSAPVFGDSLTDEPFTPSFVSSTCQEMETKEICGQVETVIENLLTDSLSDLNMVRELTSVSSVCSSPLYEAGDVEECSSEVVGPLKPEEKSFTEVVSPLKVEEKDSTEGVSLWKPEEKSFSEVVSPLKVEEKDSSEGVSLWKPEEKSFSEVVSPLKVEEKDSSEGVNLWKPEEKSFSEVVSPLKVEEKDLSEGVSLCKPEEKSFSEVVSPLKLQEKGSSDAVSCWKPEDKSSTEVVSPLKLEEKDSSEGVSLWKSEEKSFSEVVSPLKVEEKDSSEGVSLWKPEEKSFSEVVSPLKVEEKDLSEGVSLCKPEEKSFSEVVCPLKLQEKGSSDAVSCWKPEDKSSTEVVSLRKPEEKSSTEVVGLSKPEEKKVVAKSRTPEEALAAREDRLKRLEEQAKWLMNKMNATNRRGSALSTRLEELHEAYGEPPVPPPMPDVLPSQRLRTNLSDLPLQVPESSTMEGAENTEKSVPSGDKNESTSNNAP